MIPSHLQFRHLKRAVPIERVLAERGWLSRMRLRGQSLVGPCPIHGGDNPGAFVVHREKNIWHCFTRCDGGGDVVEMARRLEGGSYRAAALYLASLVGGETRAAAAPDPAWSVPPTQSFRPFTKRLWLDPQAPFLRQKGISPRTARSFDVGAYNGRGMLAGCLAVRLFDPGGQPLGYTGRRLDPEIAACDGKWTMPRGMPRNTLLYAYHRLARRARRGLVLVECPWGAMRLDQVGIPAVALLGTHMSSIQEALLRQEPRVVLLMDGDEAGRNAARRIRRRLPGVLVVDLPEGLDPDDLEDRDLVSLVRHLV